MLFKLLLVALVGFVAVQSYTIPNHMKNHNIGPITQYYEEDDENLLYGEEAYDQWSRSRKVKHHQEDYLSGGRQVHNEQRSRSAHREIHRYDEASDYLNIN